MTEPTSSLPCPPWCEKPSGHGFLPVDVSGNMIRFHSAWFGGRLVELSLMETAASSDGPVDPTLVPEFGIWVNNPGVNPLTGPQARDLAAALVQAADTYDRARP